MRPEVQDARICIFSHASTFESQPPGPRPPAPRPPAPGPRPLPAPLRCLGSTGSRGTIVCSMSLTLPPPGVEALLLALVLGAAVYDVRYRRIPNWLTLLGVL